MKRFLGVLFVIPSIILLGGLFGSSSASAASEYDNTIQNTQELILTEDYQQCNGSNSINITDNYATYYEEENATYYQYNGMQEGYSHPDTQAAILELRRVMRGDIDGKYFISQRDMQVDNKREVVINWTVLSQAEASFNTYAGGQKALDIDSGSWSQLILRKGNNCDVEVFIFEIGLPGRITIGDWSWRGYNDYKPFAISNNLVINYPENYEGEEVIGDSGSLSEWEPDIKLHKGSNWLVELSDYNFYTFDKVAFLCSDDLAPVITWEVWDVTDDDNRVLIDTLKFGAAAVVEYQAPKLQVAKKYELVAYYSDCPGFLFTSASTKQFTIKADGNLKSTDLAAVCIMDEFPWINIPNCLGDINDLLVTLTFRTPTAGDVGGGGFLTLVNGCRELQVLDDWMMSPGTTVCPKMPAFVRSTITPFIVFGLALLAIMVFTRRGGSTI